MPTLAVQPDDSESLQAIANALVKARKVVVVTGAGISTNSGIPDFRSENGLYQLIQEQYETVVKGPVHQAPAPQPEKGNSDEPLNGDEFPEDRPRKRQKLDQVHNEETSALPEITVGDGACAGAQGTADGDAAKEEGKTTACAEDNFVLKGLPGDAPPTKLKENPRRSRANSLPPARRRSTRLNPDALDSMAPPEQTQPVGPEVPSTPTKTRRRTITTIQPGCSSPLSDAPSQVSSPSQIFDRPSFVWSSSPLSDPPSHLGNSSPFLRRRPTHLPPVSPSSSSLLSDPPGHLASSPFLRHLVLPRGSSPLSDLPTYLPSSPPFVDSQNTFPLPKSSSPLSSPPPFVIHPYEDLQSCRTASRESSPSPETREAPSNSHNPCSSTSGLASQGSRLTVQESSQSNSFASSQHPSQPSREEDRADGETKGRHRGSNRSACSEPSSQQPPTKAAESRDADQYPSSQPVSSQGSTSARLPIPNIKGRDLFDATIWSCPVRTSVFYTFATTLRQKVRDVTPTSSHLFIGHLRDRGKLVRCYTQNIDRIEEKVGLSTALERGPGHRSRFSRRAPALSRINSAATDVAAADSGLPFTGAGGEAADSLGPPRGQQETAHEGRDDGSSGSLRQGQLDLDVPGLSDGIAADGARTAGSDAPSGQSGNPGDPGPLQGNPGAARQPLTEGAGLQRGSTATTVNVPISRCDGPRAADNASITAVTEATGVTGQSQESSLPILDPTESSPSSQEGPGVSEAGSTAVKPKDRQRLSSPSSGVECVFLHGSLECLRCFRCRRICEWEGREEQTFFGQQPECPHCAGATAAREERGKRALGVGKLRPDIVLYGEEHPNAHLISPVVTHDLGLGPDLLLILGTSLKVHGLKVLVRQFSKAVHSKGGKVVFVNFTKPPESSWGDIIDYWVAWDCDAWVSDLKEKVPALWLPPGKEPKNRKSISIKGAEKKTGEKKSAAAKKKGAVGGKKGASKKDGKASEEIVVSSQESTTTDVVAEAIDSGTNICTLQEGPASIGTAPLQAELPSHQQSQPSSQAGPQEARPKQQRIALREDKINGAYFTWKIMESLRRISGREAPPPMELQSVTASRAIAAAEANQAKRDRRRRSTMPAGRAEQQARGLGTEPQMPEVWSIHSSAPAVIRQDGTSPKMTFPPLRPSPLENSGAASSVEWTPLPLDLHYNHTPTPKPSWGPLADTSIPARVDPRKRKLACLQPPPPPELLPSHRPTSPPSILSAVKSNPRKRKRKTIDGEEVVLPSVGSRRPSPSSDKENTEVRRPIPSLSAQPMDGSPIRLPPLRGTAFGGWKPAPMEPVSPPEGPAVRVEWGRGAARTGDRTERTKDPFFYQDILPGLGGAWDKSLWGGRNPGRRGREGIR